MLIHSMEFENYTTGQKIEKITFDKLNLLVGCSGAGKTQILKTLSSYIVTASRDPVISSIQFEGYFKLEFSMFLPKINDDDDFKEREVSWEIRTEKMENIVSEPYRLAYGVSEEILFIDGEEVIHRTKDTLLIGKEKNATISPEQSAISVFKVPKAVSYISVGLFSVVSYYYQMSALNDVAKTEVEQIRNRIARLNKSNYFSSKIPIQVFFTFYSSLMQIDLVKKYDQFLFEKFLSRLQDIFPSIEDLKIDFLENTNYYTLFIKENDKWIPKESISSGMLKSIYILVAISFNLSSTVVLLDELENSLGVNCLDEITDYIVDKAESNTQFILTSHHPYIINHIPEKYWHIVSQDHGIISSKRANDIGISTVNNKQDKFFQLINYMQRQ